MTDDAEWGPWIEHDGRGCPLVDGVWCHRVFDRPVPATASDKNAVGKSEDISPVVKKWEFKAWDWSGGATRIIRYRIRKPRALKQLRELVENPSAPTERVDA